MDIFSIILFSGLILFFVTMFYLAVNDRDDYELQCRLYRQYLSDIKKYVDTGDIETVKILLGYENWPRKPS
jgi:hypothetical protein